MPRVGLNALEAILDAAQELFVARGFKATAVKDIAAAVGAKDAPLYNHFVGKQALFDGIIERDLAYPKTALHRGVSARGWALTRFVPRAIGRGRVLWQGNRQRAAAMSCWERRALNENDRRAPFADGLHEALCRMGRRKGGASGGTLCAAQRPPPWRRRPAGVLRLVPCNVHQGGEMAETPDRRAS